LAISTASTQKYWHFLGNKYYYFCVPKFWVKLSVFLRTFGMNVYKLRTLTIDISNE
jgi:hypothetical protein